MEGAGKQDATRGEAVTLIRAGYRIDCIRPCGEAGRKLVEARLTLPVGGGGLSAAERAFPKAESFPKLGMVRFNVGSLAAMLYADGRLVIRKVGEIGEAVAAAEKVVAAIAKEGGKA